MCTMYGLINFPAKAIASAIVVCIIIAIFIKTMQNEWEFIRRCRWLSSLLCLNLTAYENNEIEQIIRKII